MLATLVTPLIFLFALPERAEEIVAFMRDRTTRLVGVGDVCSYASFDLRGGGVPGRWCGDGAGAGAGDRRGDWEGVDGPDSNPTTKGNPEPYT